MGVTVNGSTPSAPGGAGIVEKMANDAAGLGTGLAQGLGGVIDGIADSLSGVFQGGIFSRLDSTAEIWRDGQETLERRTDLLDPLLDYGSVCMPAGLNITGTGPLPYRQQIGPMRGVSITHVNGGDGAGLKLNDVGLWDIRLQITASWVRLLTPKVEVALNVYSPAGGAPFSTQKAILMTEHEQTMTIVSSVVVDGPGFYAIPWVNINAGTRQILGGPGWSRLTAQHISRAVDGSWADGSEGSDEPPAAPDD